MHRLDVAELGGLGIPVGRELGIERDAEALLVERAQAVLGDRFALLGCALEPLRRLGIVRVDAIAIGIFQPKQQLRRPRRLDWPWP